MSMNGRHISGQRRTRQRLLLSAAVVLLAAVSFPPSSAADTIRGPDLWVVYPEGAEAEAAWVHDKFPALLRSTSAWLGVETEGHVTIYLVEDLEGMKQYLGCRDPRAAGVLSAPGRIGIRLDYLEFGGWWDLERILTHETVHLVTAHLPRPRLPNWLNEGLATWRAEGELRDEERDLIARLERDQLPRFSRLQKPWKGRVSSLVYPVGQSAVGYFLDRYGEAGLHRLTARLAAGRPFETAFEDATGSTVDEFEESWRDLLKRGGRYHLHRSLVTPGILLGTCALTLAAAWWILRQQRKRTLAGAAARRGALVDRPAIPRPRREAGHMTSRTDGGSRT